MWCYFYYMRHKLHVVVVIIIFLVYFIWILFYCWYGFVSSYEHIFKHMWKKGVMLSVVVLSGVLYEILGKDRALTLEERSRFRTRRQRKRNALTSRSYSTHNDFDSYSLPWVGGNGAKRLFVKINKKKPQKRSHSKIK